MGTSRDHMPNGTVWTGQYWLKDRDRESVPFSVWLNVKDGKLTGSTLEPNAFALIQDEELDATIRGHINDEEVVFLKSYRSFEHDPVYFEGELSENGQEVVGKWYFGWPNEWSGPFEMKLSQVDTAWMPSSTKRAKPAT